MSPLCARMIEDMSLAGLAEGTQKVYARRCAGWPLITVDRLDLLEEEVPGLPARPAPARGVARSTLQTSRFGLRFFYPIPPRS